MERVRTGIPNLDAILGGGLVRGDAVLVKGGPGTGKTALGLQWVCRGAIDYGEPGAIVVLEETPQQLYGRASAFGWDLRRLEAQNKVRTIFTSAEALSQDILTSSLLVGMLAEIGARRVAIDPITNYRPAFPDERRLRQQVYSTINALKRIGQTSLLLAELGPANREGPAPEEYLADVVISLGRLLGELSHFRRLEVLKSSTHDHRPRSALFGITQTGIKVTCRYHSFPSEGPASKIPHQGPRRDYRHFTTISAVLPPGRLLPGAFVSFEWRPTCGERSSIWR